MNLLVRPYSVVNPSSRPDKSLKGEPAGNHINVCIVAIMVYSAYKWSPPLALEVAYPRNIAAYVLLRSACHKKYSR